MPRATAGAADAMVPESNTEDLPPALMLLPLEALVLIAGFLDVEDVCALAQTCKRAREYFTGDNILWRELVRRDMGFDIDLSDICAGAAVLLAGGCHTTDARPAVDRAVHSPPSVDWRCVCSTYRRKARGYLKESRFPLHRAMEEQDTLTALYLIHRAPYLDITLRLRDLDGISVLDTSASVGDRVVTRVLCVRNLADPGESAPDGWTPLMKACANGDVAMTRLLLSLGASRTVNARTSHYRWTALHYACKGGHYECAKVLLEFGADRACRDFAYRVPVELWGSSTCVSKRGKPPCAEEVLVRSMLRSY